MSELFELDPALNDKTVRSQLLSLTFHNAEKYNSLEERNNTKQSKKFLCYR